MEKKSAREIIRKRRIRKMTLRYFNDIDKIIKIQSWIRVFLARRRVAKIANIQDNELRELASVYIQSAYRGYCVRRNIIEENAASITITNFIFQIPFLRKLRLRKIRNNLLKIKLRQLVANWVKKYRYVEVPPIVPIRERQENYILPRDQVNVNNRLERYNNNREARQQARQHNWDVLNRRLRVIRRDIDSLLPNNDNEEPQQTPDRINTTQPTENRTLNNEIIPNVQIPPIETRRIERPRNYLANIQPRVDTNNRPRTNRQDRNRNILTPVLNNNERHNVITPTLPEIQNRNTRIINIEERIERPITPVHLRVRHRLQELEHQFRDPRIRALYQNNRIILPDGNRVIPIGNNGDMRLQPDPLAREVLPSFNDIAPINPATARDCPICFEKKANFRMINPGCDHLICFQCTQSMIMTALGNVSTNIPIKCPMSNENCNNMITPYTKGVKELLTKRDFEKFEKYHIIKEHVPANYLRYCPNSNCGMPFEINDNILDTITSPPRKINYRLFTSCIECETLICMYCNDYAHQGLSCKEFQEKQQNDNKANSEYIKNYCKKCPICKVNVQKQQSQEQENHEKTTGMAGGTSECHHVTCGSCKRDFCWTCLKAYTGATYYHRTCPNEDCLIRFVGKVPNISNLPIGQQNYIKVIIYNDDKLTDIQSQQVYQINNYQVVLGANMNNYTTKNKTVILHCLKNGIVKRLQGLLGDYSFRQQSKGLFNLK
tara:strand:+ start:1396 stop:3558 length:2163 start_codon:yes stop_codon:yes gene_type:complete